MILVETGPLVAAGNRADEYHAKSVRALATAKPPRLVPATVLAETGYLLERAAGPAVEAEFMRLFSSGYLKLAEPTRAPSTPTNVSGPSGSLACRARAA